MRRWIYTSDGEWWIDRDPPLDDDRAIEVGVGNQDDEVVVEVTPVFSGRHVVRRALGRTPDLADLRALLAEHMHVGLRAISVGEQRAKLEDLIDCGRMRAWRRRRRRIGSSGGAGFMEGVETPPLSRLPRIRKISGRLGRRLPLSPRPRALSCRPTTPSRGTSSCS